MDGGLLEILKELPEKVTHVATLEAIRRRKERTVENLCLDVAIIGGKGAGKSTFVNRVVLGTDIVPESAAQRPELRVERGHLRSTMVSYDGDDHHAEVTMHGDDASMREHLRRILARPENVTRVSLEHPRATLASGWKSVTVNELPASAMDISDRLDRADFDLYVLVADTVQRPPWLSKLYQRLKAGRMHRMFMLVCTHADAPGADSSEEARKSWLSSLGVSTSDLVGQRMMMTPESATPEKMRLHFVNLLAPDTDAAHRALRLSFDYMVQSTVTAQAVDSALRDQLSDLCSEAEKMLWDKARFAQIANNPELVLLCMKLITRLEALRHDEKMTNG